MKRILEPTAALAPVPVALVSCGNNRVSNITTIAWTGIVCSEPMLVYISIRQSRYSHEIVCKTNEFIINLPKENQVIEADFCGTKSGRELDKFRRCNFTKGFSNKISAPYIKECPINIECKVKEIKKMGSHDMFIAEVLSVNADEELIDENNNILFEKAGLISFAGKKYYAANDEIGYRGICLGNN